jgi:hypothetical protein
MATEICPFPARAEARSIAPTRIDLWESRALAAPSRAEGGAA